MTARRPRFAPARTGLLGAGALAAVLAACEAKLPTESQVAQMDVASAERSAKTMAWALPAADANTAYTVDGRTVTAAQARALKPNEIARIEMLRKRGGPGEQSGEARSEVRIATRAALGLGAAAERAPGDTGSRIRIIRVPAKAPGAGAPAGDVAGIVAASHREGAEPFTGLLLVDGVRAEPTRLRSIGPGDIVSVEVIKGPAAAKLHAAPEAARGVIKITTRAGAARK